VLPGVQVGQATLGGMRGREPKSSLTIGYRDCRAPAGRIGSGRSTRLVLDAGGCTGLKKLLTLYTVPLVPSNEVDGSFRGLLSKGGCELPFAFSLRFEICSQKTRTEGRL
jgi:hypothetical protein